MGIMSFICDFLFVAMAILLVSFCSIFVASVKLVSPIWNVLKVHQYIANMYNEL